MMRKEIEAVVFREGWSKSGLDKMKRLDSFIKESLRLSAVEPCSSSSFSLGKTNDGVL